MLDGCELVHLSHWHVSFDVEAYGSSKVKVFCSLIVNLGVHMF